MHLAFEDWIASQGIGVEAKGLFAEAIVCYKASAYRAALLLSYLGFQTVVKERILAARRRPTEIPEGQWNDILRRLRNDDTWDPAVFTAIQMRPPVTVFGLSEDITTQVAYWRGRRNDCAHSKGNAIEFSHVEAFWLFVQSNLAKFAVSGSREALLDAIRVHFDRSLTPAGADSGPIVEQIPAAIVSRELPEFFEEIHRLFTEPRGLAPIVYSEDQIAFFDRMLDIADVLFGESLITFLKREDRLLAGILKHNSTRLLAFAEDPAFIRKLWYDYLPPVYGSAFTLYCSLLRNGLIPADQLQEAHRRVIHSLWEVPLTNDTLQVLEASGFFEAFRGPVFVRSDTPHGRPLIEDFSWANSNRQLVVLYLHRYGIDREVARTLSRVFSRPNHPYELKESLDEYLLQRPEKRDEFLRAFQQYEIRVPDYLQLQVADSETP